MQNPIVPGGAAINPPTGLTGKDFENDSQFNTADGEVGRLDESWPEDSFGAKLNLGSSVINASNRMEPGVIEKRWREIPEDPSVSQAQNRAMHAAAEGHSNLDIPQSVGEEFVKADQGRKIGHLPKHSKHKEGH